MKVSSEEESYARENSEDSYKKSMPVAKIKGLMGSLIRYGAGGPTGIEPVSLLPRPKAMLIVFLIVSKILPIIWPRNIKAIRDKLSILMPILITRETIRT